MEERIRDLYLKNGKEKTYFHALDVAKTAKILASSYGLDEDVCYKAGLLHDISVILSAQEMNDYAIKLNFEIDEAEKKHPFLLHQRFSKLIAQSYFKIADNRILSSVECHTTLKKYPSQYDCLIFLADKLAWDQEGAPPYLIGLKKAMTQSLENGSLYFISYQLENGGIIMPHRWLMQAKKYLEGQ